METDMTCTQGQNSQAEPLRNRADAWLQQLETDLKTAQAAALACRAAAERRRQSVCERARLWVQRAANALARGRDDLAREALVLERTLRGEAALLGEEAQAASHMAAAYAAELRTVRANLAGSQDLHACLWADERPDAASAGPVPLWALRRLSGRSGPEAGVPNAKSGETGSLLAKVEVGALLEDLEVEYALEALRRRPVERGP